MGQNPSGWNRGLQGPHSRNGEDPGEFLARLPHPEIPTTSLADETMHISTNGPQASTNDTPELPGGAAASTWSGLRRTTLQLAAVFWSAVLLSDSILWGIAGVDPLESFSGKLVLNSFGALLTIGMSALLFRVRRRGILFKAAMAFALSLACAPLYSLFDFQVYTFYVAPEVPEFSWRNFGYTMVSSMAMFFGWSCLYVSMVYAFEVRDRERSLAAAREEALLAQMRALRYQANPHFLFNTLNSIAGLVEEGATARAGRMLLSLSMFLRTTLTIDPLQDVTLAEELVLQEDYLEIEQERFSDRMGFAVDAAEEVRHALVPSLILQPLIENAVKHGVGQSAAHTQITIRALRQQNVLRLVVENDLPAGRHPSADTVVGFGIGLRNVADRLRMRFGESGRFSARTQGGQFRAEIELPWRTR